MPKCPTAKWRNLKTVSHFQGMKAIANQDAPHLRRTISAWDAEVKIPEQKIYSLYFRAFLFMMWRSEPAWLGMLEKADEVVAEGSLERFKEYKLRTVFATVMWASAMRGNVERHDQFSKLARQYGEPEETIIASNCLCERKLDNTKELLEDAIKGVSKLESPEFYTEFLRSTFSEEHLAMLDVVPEEALA